MLSKKLKLIGEDLLAHTIQVIDRLGISEKQLERYILPCIRYTDDKADFEKLSMMLVLSSKYLYDNFEEKEALFKMIAKDIIVMNELKRMSLIDKVKGEALHIVDYLDYLTQLDNYSIGSDRYLFSYFSNNEELLNEIINGRKVYGVKIDTMNSDKGRFVHKVYMDNKKLGELESDIGAVCSITADKTLILRDRVGTLSLELNLTDKINRYIDILNNIECFYSEKELKLIQYGIVSVVSKNDNITLDDFWRCR